MSSLGPGVTEIFDAFDLSATIRRTHTPDTNITLYNGGICSGQLENQKFDEYLVQLKTQAKKCEFG
jgi:sRNA-binding regulator protein Hfq